MDGTVVSGVTDSLEVRWIGVGSGPDPDRVVPDPAASSGERIDHYAPSSDRVGVKLRDGGIEIKALVDELDWPALRLGTALRGVCGRWRKWRCPWPGGGGDSGDSGDSGDEELLTAGGWIPLRKDRRLARRSHGGIQAEIECTRLEILDRSGRSTANTWWTVCVEVPVEDDPAGSHAALVAELESLAGDQAIASVLGSGASYPIPAWLHRATGSGEHHTHR